MNVFVLVIATLLVNASAFSEKKIVCYFADWASNRPGDGKFDVSDVDPTLCTHVIYSFVLPKDDGSINIGDGTTKFSQFLQLRKQNPSLKLMVAIGGWNEHSERFTKVAANPSLRSAFTQNVYNLLKKYGFDGFDVDWEYPAQWGGVPDDKSNFVQLLRELKEKLAPEGFLLSAAVAIGQWSADQSYDIPQISQYLDFINLMAYDMHGPWETVAAIHAPLYSASWENDKNANIDSSVKYWAQHGAPVGKLVLGAPFYGKGFTLASDSSKPGSPASGPCHAGPYSRESGTLNYNEICEKIKNDNWQVGFEQEQRAPYAFYGNQWVGYDDERSLMEKVDYVNNNGLGGMMIWSLDGDDFRGKCNGVKYPLLKTINKALNGGAPSLDLPQESLYNQVSNSLNDPSGSYGQDNYEPSNQYQTQDQFDHNQQYRQMQTTEVPQNSNEICNGQSYVNDPKNPANFYQCWYQDGQIYKKLLLCPPGTVFNAHIGNCDWPQ